MRIIVVKIGDKHRPASEADIKDTEKRIKKAFKHMKKRPTVFVTHHAFDISVLNLKKDLKK